MKLFAAAIYSLVLLFGLAGPAFATCKAGEVTSGPFCIPTSAQGFAGWFLGIGIGLGTLIAILFIIVGGYTILTSAGNPDMVEEGKQKITSAIEGLLFILFSILILRIIGVQIIGIPEFKFGF